MFQILQVVSFLGSFSSCFTKSENASLMAFLFFHINIFLGGAVVVSTLFSNINGQSLILHETPPPPFVFKITLALCNSSGTHIDFDFLYLQL